jgi:mycothiol synthase
MNTSLQVNHVVEIPEGFTARGASMNDIELAFRLFNRWSRSVLGRDEFADPQSIREEWQFPGADPAEDVCLVFAPNGDLAGYIEVWTTVPPTAHPELWGRVDPRYEDIGIGTWMLHWAEQRALQALEHVPAELRFAPRVGTFRQAEKAKRLFEDFGYRHIRTFYHMLIEMDSSVSAPEFPEGIELRPFIKGEHDAAVWQAQNEAFRDHWGHQDVSFEEWKYDRLEDSEFDPTLWFLAIDGRSGEIAGYAICRPHSFQDPTVGWVRSLGVRRPWRKRGIGLALLRQAFHEFYRRSKCKVGLGVDAQNLTGALRLYENAGMQVDRAFDYYEKELRPGRNPDEEQRSAAEY